MNPQKHLFLSQEIIKYLNSKDGKSDDLDGIVIAIYENEIKNLTEKIMNELAMLLAKGIITEFKNHDRKNWFKLTSNKEVIF